jgi:XTP/dITP diphosphohydrolase
VVWIVATRSRGKLHELVPMLAANGIEAIGLDAAGVAPSPAEDDIECFETFEANALAKARYFAALTGRVCIADDSGLCVDALGGRPGVRSRRFASDFGISSTEDGEDDANNSALLDACWDSGWAPPWSAHYACAAAYADGKRTLVAIGRTDGSIFPERDGSGGFGYDPHFFSTDLGVTFAAAHRDQKALVSHRGRAFANLLARVRDADSAASAR